MSIRESLRAVLAPLSPIINRQLQARAEDVLRCASQAVAIMLISMGCGPRSHAAEVRLPAVSGQFYPADKDTLDAMVRSYLKNVKRKVTEGDIVALMAPHAGYIFSGQTAACAFKEVEGKNYGTVILLGCPHRAHVIGAAVDPSKSYRTPLGDVPLDSELAAKIMQESERIRPDTSAHTEEHSLEVEIPFLQVALKQFRIVPILIGHGKDMPEIVAEAIVKQMKGRNDVLVVGSSDMTHYPAYKDAVRIDTETLQAIAALSPEKLVDQLRKYPENAVPQLSCVLCGDRAILATMLIARKLGANRAVVLHYSNSGDVPHGDPGGVVGYGAVAFVRTEQKAEPLAPQNPQSFMHRFEFDPLDEAAQKELLSLARQAIVAKLEGKNLPPSPPRNPALLHCRGVFVTILRDGELRGCIGHHIDDQPLYKLVPEMALASAFGDSRFEPLTRDELAKIKIKVSAYLCRVFRAQSADEFKVGEHGIILIKGRRGATFLPEVPTEQGWDKPTTLQHLCRKAGLPPDAWKKDALFFLYRTQCFGE